MTATERATPWVTKGVVALAFTIIVLDVLVVVFIIKTIRDRLPVIGIWGEMVAGHLSGHCLLCIVHNVHNVRGSCAACLLHRSRSDFPRSITALR